MLNAIYSSKLFLCSNRKEEIRSKIQAAVNTELVQQLIKDLDDEYQTLDNVAPELSDNVDVLDNTNTEKSNQIDEEQHSETSSHIAPSNPSVGQPIDFEDVSEDESSTEEGIEENPSSDDKQPIEQSTQIFTFSADVLKGTLNHSSDTCGVTRVEKKENEVWIYYNDETNLNNVMTDVIEMLNSTGYTYLSFNRLARSHNAIVFELTDNTCKVGDVIE